MRLLPAGQERPSDFDDGAWIEKPGFPPSDGTWLHPTLGALPEFEFEEGHDKTKNEPPYRLVIGTHADAQIRVDNPQIPRRHCMVFKEGRDWFLESLSSAECIWLGDRCMERGLPEQLQSGDIFSLLRPPTPYAYRIWLEDADNWYIDLNSDKDFANKWPSKMPGHASEAPPAPEELKRLAWQTDQMRRRSEEDQVRVADWAAFSQYVKRHYHKYGIFAKPWAGSVGPPVERPPPMAPRAFPEWIAALAAEERMLPYIEREYPFQDQLELSGHSLAKPLTPRATLPRGPASAWGEARQEGFRSGGAGVMVGDTTLLEAAVGRTLADHGGVGAAAAGSSGDSGSSGIAGSAGALTGAAASGLGSGSVGSGAFPRKPEAAVVAPMLVAYSVSFRDWLMSLEDSQFLICYHDRIAAQFDSLDQVADLYVRAGVLDDRFFEVVGVKKLGHKRAFQKWFRDVNDV
eukprot:CAMPEP_0203912252 /NCGR_PEP_ID=MMETSP0359-20131031/53336_1 /ASSEMBLY_ACC=CAM_ASM_000338 /TAXON_ID=268821 /ORGANISM="Scrippsiella Hangoei, Strain SHTV-5" /LENGTH=459 /DNA_ID=CAMNT_0050838147 /DNA_START=33 /DNA_END=1412 /DNA_ORIENTATION=-